MFWYFLSNAIKHNCKTVSKTTTEKNVTNNWTTLKLNVSIPLVEFITNPFDLLIQWNIVLLSVCTNNLLIVTSIIKHFPHFIDKIQKRSICRETWNQFRVETFISSHRDRRENHFSMVLFPWVLVLISCTH